MKHNQIIKRQKNEKKIEEREKEGELYLINKNLLKNLNSKEK